MTVTLFDPGGDLIYVHGRVRGPLRPQGMEVRLILDTGAAETILVPDVLDRLGYSPRDGETNTVMRSAVAREEGYLIRVRELDCLGFRTVDFRVHAHDLPEGWGIEGLIGLSFLRQLNYEVRSLEGLLRAERAERAA